MPKMCYFYVFNEYILKQQEQLKNILIKLKTINAARLRNSRNEPLLQVLR